MELGALTQNLWEKGLLILILREEVGGVGYGSTNFSERDGVSGGGAVGGT